MPSIHAILKELVAGRELSYEQTIDILEHRRAAIARCLDTFTAQTLGQLTCLDSGNGFCHEVARDSPDVTDEPFSLKTQGVFAGTPFARRKFTDIDGHLEINVYTTFGVARSGEWLLIEIEFANDVIGQQLFSNKTYERALSVHVSKSDVLTILETMELSPLHLWAFFKMIVEDWVSARKRLYENALKVTEYMREEDALFSLFHH